jgi:thioredoxin reductase (NADPH)
MVKLMQEYETDIVIVGGGPIGLFMVFQAGMLNMRAHVIDTLDSVGGQCAALYPEKPIYDIPAYAKITGQDLIDQLYEQAMPFEPVFHLKDQVIAYENVNDGIVVKTLANKIIKAKVMVIAGGCGSFGPNRPPIANIEEFEGKSVFYYIKNRAIFENKNIVIAGGGDSAVDWAVSLAEIAKSVSVVHRRPKFRCLPASYDKLMSLADNGKIDLIIPYQLDDIIGENGHLKQVLVKDLDENVKALEADYLLAFFGLSMELGPILNWGLDIKNHYINVNQATQATNISRIYAVGDICTYQNKLKLILTGFSECAIAAHDMYKFVYPDKPLHFEHSTTRGIAHE